MKEKLRDDEGDEGESPSGSGDLAGFIGEKGEVVG